MRNLQVTVTLSQNCGLQLGHFKFNDEILNIFFRYNRTPLIQMMVIQIANYLDRLRPLGKFVKTSIKPSCLEFTSYGSSTVQCYAFQNFKSGVVKRFRGRYILQIVTAILQTAYVAYLKKNYPDFLHIWIAQSLP